MVREAGQEKGGKFWHEEARGKKQQGNYLDTVPVSAQSPGAL